MRRLPHLHAATTLKKKQIETYLLKLVVHSVTYILCNLQDEQK